MTAGRTAEEWGRVAVSLPGWRWMPGMQRIGRDLRTTDSDFFLSGHEASVMDGCIPDPDDPATAGCLFVLLGPGAMVRHDQHRGSHPDDYTAVTATGPRGDSSSAGRACIAAAEALGRWPGGVG